MRKCARRSGANAGGSRMAILARICPQDLDISRRICASHSQRCTYAIAREPSHMHGHINDHLPKGLGYASPHMRFTFTAMCLLHCTCSAMRIAISPRTQHAISPRAPVHRVTFHKPMSIHKKRPLRLSSQGRMRANVPCPALPQGRRMVISFRCDDAHVKLPGVNVNAGSRTPARPCACHARQFTAIFAPAPQGLFQRACA